MQVQIDGGVADPNSDGFISVRVYGELDESVEEVAKAYTKAVNKVKEGSKEDANN